MSKLWVTADLHLGHKNIVTYCNRPFRTLDGSPDVEAMNQHLCLKWRECVAPEDTIIVVGDYILGHKAPILPGRKILVKGNHDTHTNITYIRMGFERVVKRIDLRCGGVVIRHHPYKDSALEIAHNNRLIICGHVHERWAECAVGMVRYVNVGVDVRGFAPVLVQDIMENPLTSEEVWDILDL